MTRAAAPLPPADGSFRGIGQPNLLCTILFIDLVGYSSRSIDDQVALKMLVNGLVTRALVEGVPDGRLAIDTGDGAALCFMAEPVDAFHAALRLRQLLGRHCGMRLPVRMGLNHGPVRRVPDVNGRPSIIGDGMNVAHRIMAMARPGEVLATQAYLDAISRIPDSASRLFHYLGPRQDKHGRLHEVHAVVDPTPLWDGLPPRPAQAKAPWDWERADGDWLSPEPPGQRRW